MSTAAAPSRTFGEAVRVCVTERYADFAGRASRSEYWWFFLFNMVVGYGLFFVAAAADVPALLILWGLVSLALLVPGIAVSVRRMHDTGRSGWYLLIGLIPLVGGFIVLYFLVQQSDGPNEYGS